LAFAARWPGRTRCFEFVVERELASGKQVQAFLGFLKERFGAAT
jgi:hypothetical protein